MFRARANPFGYPGIGSAVCLLIALTTLTAFGQSGRRGSKSPPISVPTPEAPQPEKKPVVNDQPKLNLVVGMDRGNGFGTIPSYYYDSVIESCAARLNDSRRVQLEVVPGEMTRGDAIKRAKGEQETYVVWLQLRVDTFNRTAGTNADDMIYIEYTLFEPTTAKIRMQGNSYQGLYRQGGITIPGTSGRTNTMITERRLQDAAQDAAVKILKALHIALPSDIPPHWN